MGLDRAMKILQHIPALQPTRLHDGQNALDESAARLAVAAKTAPTPQHGATQKTLHVVVRRLNALVPHERPQRGLQLQDVLAKLLDARIVAERSFQIGRASCRER